MKPYILEENDPSNVEIELVTSVRVRTELETKTNFFMYPPFLSNQPIWGSKPNFF